jgi:Fe2+ or Zn2+ uptake regulation protein
MDVNQVLAYLSRLGHRITLQRRAVVAAIFATPCLQSVEEIYEKCKGLDRAISLPTIYRTLDILVEAEVVRKLHFGQGRSWFEPVARGGDHHHHLVCRECGMKTPMASCPQRLIEEEASRNQFVVLDHQFEILGICKGCRKP